MKNKDGERTRKRGAADRPPYHMAYICIIIVTFVWLINRIFFRQRILFFSHNKSINSTFSYDLSAKRTEQIYASLIFLLLFMHAPCSRPAARMCCSCARRNKRTCPSSIDCAVAAVVCLQPFAAFVVDGCH